MRSSSTDHRGIVKFVKVEVDTFSRAEVQVEQRLLVVFPGTV